MALDNVTSHFSTMLEPIASASFLSSLSIIHDFIGEITSFEAPNLKSALQNPDTLFSKLSKELDAGRIAGAFDTAPFPVFRTSPVGILPKKVPHIPKAYLLTIAFRMTALPYNMPRLLTPLTFFNDWGRVLT